MRRKTFRSRPQRVALFVTCMVDMIYPQVGMATVELLEKQGLEVVFIEEQTCCGQPAFNGGFWDDARVMAKHTLDLLSATSGPIVIPSGSCADMIIHHYSELLHDDPTYAYKIKQIAERTYEFTQFLVDELGITDVGARCIIHFVVSSRCNWEI